MFGVRSHKVLPQVPVLNSGELFARSDASTDALVASVVSSGRDPHAIVAGSGVKILCVVMESRLLGTSGDTVRRFATTIMGIYSQPNSMFVGVTETDQLVDHRPATAHGHVFRFWASSSRMSFMGFGRIYRILRGRGVFSEISCRFTNNYRHDSIPKDKDWRNRRVGSKKRLSQNF